MTLPNKLTIGRILAVPAMIVVACIPYLNDKMIYASFSLANLINLIIFILASLTDFLDGYLARKYNLVTTFGKFADPLADKMLVLTSLLILLNQHSSVCIGSKCLNLVPMWGVAIILLRELTVSGIRLVAAEKGQVIAAGWAGKVKTFETMIAIMFLFLAGLHKSISYIGLFGMYAAIILTLYSGLVYINNSKKLIFESI